MRRSSLFSLALASIALPSALYLGCSGSDGKDGAPGATGAVGPAGSSTPADPSISAVVPSSAFLGRTLDVLVSGYGTKFDATTTVDFGQDVTVNKVTVASPTAALVNITVGTAYVGAHDVKIGTLEYKGAFTTTPPTSLKVDGKTQQGSISIVHGQNHDFDAPFDTSYTGDGFFTPIEYTGIKVSTFPGVDLQVNGVSAYTVDLLALIDVTAEPGAKDLDIMSGPAGSQTHNPIPGGLNIEATTPVDLVAGTPAEGTVENAFQSYLFKFTPAAGSTVMEYSAAVAGSDGAAAIALLPKSGKFADLISFSTGSVVRLSNADPYYLVVWDNSGVFGYDFTISANNMSPAEVAETASNNETSANAQALSALPVLITGGDLTDGDDQDWFKFTAAAGDIGKKVRVMTLAGDQSTDTVVDVFRADGTTSMGGPSDDAGYHENFTSTSINAAGDIYVKIYASDYFSASQTKYDALIMLK